MENLLNKKLIIPETKVFLEADGSDSVKLKIEQKKKDNNKLTITDLILIGVSLYGLYQFLFVNHHLM